MAHKIPNYNFEAKFVCGCRKMIPASKIYSASYVSYCKDCENKKTKYSKNVTTKMYDDQMEAPNYRSLFYKTDIYDSRSYSTPPIRIVKYFDPTIQEDLMILANIQYDTNNYVKSIETIKGTSFLENMKELNYNLEHTYNSESYSNLNNLLFEDNYLEHTSTILQQLIEQYNEIDAVEKILIQPIVLYDTIFSKSFLYPNFTDNAEFYPVDRMVLDLNKFIYINRIEQRFNIKIA